MCARSLSKRPQGAKMDGGIPASVLVAICFASGFVSVLVYH